MKTKWIMKTSNLTFSSDSLGLGMHMHCPVCGHDCTHHERVDVYQRDSEDAKTGTHLSIDGTHVYTSRSMQDNPSYRRNGLRIYFSCESCGPDYPHFSVTMVQHKGRTFFEAQYYVEDQS